MMKQSITLSAIVVAALIAHLPGSAWAQDQASRTREAIADQYAMFERGEMRFDCRVGCSFSWGYNRRTLKALYEAQAWRPLVEKLLSIGFQGDAAYYLLARAADDLGLRNQAQTYYRLSLAERNSGGKCGEAKSDRCIGLDLDGELQSRIARAPTPSPEQRAVVSNDNAVVTQPAQVQSAASHQPLVAIPSNPQIECVRSGVRGQEFDPIRMKVALGPSAGQTSAMLKSADRVTDAAEKVAVEAWLHVIQKCFDASRSWYSQYAPTLVSAVESAETTIISLTTELRDGGITYGEYAMGRVDVSAKLEAQNEAAVIRQQTAAVSNQSSTPTTSIARTTGYRPVIDTKGVDEARLEQDLVECQAYAQQVVGPGTGAAGGAVAGAVLGYVIGRTMGLDNRNAGSVARTSGISGAVGGAAGGAVNERAVIARCMSGRGYRVLN